MKVTTTVPITEREIVEIVARRADNFGYAGALCVKAFKWGDAAGTSDLVIFPKEHTGPLVAILEVKKATNEEAGALVIGQVLKYYARVLRTGFDGLETVKTALRDGKSRLRYLTLAASRSVPRRKRIGAGGQDGDLSRPISQCTS
jgi:hypothetical protein